MRRLAFFILSAQVALVAQGDAQQYAGTFIVPNDQGGSLTIQLQQNGQGTVAGTLSSNGVTYQIEGQLEDGFLVGAMYNQRGGMWFEAELDGNDLYVMLIEADANNQPNYEATTELVLTRQGSPGVPSSAPTPGSGSPRVPDPGEAAPQSQPNRAGGRPLAPGFTEDSPLALEWSSWLGGMKLTSMESYSSGTAGGYSSRWDLYLCSDRSFRQDGQSSVSVDVGGAFGNAGGQDSVLGTWRIITQGEVVGLILDLPDGRTIEYRLEYINEATYANGDRVYVTAAEICG